MPDITPSKTQATLDSLKGAVQENAGWVIGNEQMQANGAATRSKACAEYKAAQAQGYGEGVLHTIEGNIKDAAGSLAGDKKLQAKGSALKAQGEIEKIVNS